MLSKEELYQRNLLFKRQRYRTDEVYREIKRCRHIIWYYKQPLPEGKQRYNKSNTARKENAQIAEQRLEYLLNYRKQLKEEQKRLRHETVKNKTR